MPATVFYDLTLLIDMLHQTLDQLEDGVFDLAGLLPLVGSLSGRSDPGDRRHMLDGLFPDEKSQVKDAQADCQNKQKDVQYFTGPINLSEERPNHAVTPEDVSGRQRRHRGLPKPQSPDHELSQSPVLPKQCLRQP